MNSNEILLATIVINNSITKNISTQSVSKNIYYSNQITSAPTLRISGDGYASASFGNISLRNDPYDDESVFNFKEGTYPPEIKTYPITIQWGLQDSPIFEGSFSISAITETDIELNLLPPEYEKDILQLTLNNTMKRVESTSGSSGSPLRVTMNLHGIEDGSEVIFEGMTQTTQLNYDGTSSKVFKAVYVDSNNFDLEGTNAADFTKGTESTGFGGIPVVRPICFGTITHRIPVQKSGTSLSNPSLDTSITTNTTGVIRVYNDGVEVGNNVTGDPNHFTTAPTSSKITLNGSSIGDVSISGKSSLAQTKVGVFTYLASLLGLSIDSTNAPSSTGLVSIYIDSQERVIDFASKLAVALNHQFYIENGTLFLVDKMNDGAITVLDKYDINKMDISPQFPVKMAESSWQERTPFSGTSNTLGTTKRYTFSNSTKFKTGNKEQVDVFTESIQIQNSILKDRIKLIERVNISVEKNGIDFKTKIGQRLKVTDENKSITSIFTIRDISFDFNNETTTFSGDGTLEKITRS